MVIAIKCPYCNVNMVENSYLKGGNFFECKDCHSEFWPSSKDLGIKDAFQDEIRTKKALRGPSGGSSAKAKKYKKKIAAPSWYIE